MLMDKKCIKFCNSKYSRSGRKYEPEAHRLPVYIGKYIRPFDRRKCCQIANVIIAPFITAVTGVVLLLLLWVDFNDEMTKKSYHLCMSLYFKHSITCRGAPTCIKFENWIISLIQSPLSALKI